MNRRRVGLLIALLSLVALSILVPFQLVVTS
jgi:hypothetical protein